MKKLEFVCVLIGLLFYNCSMALDINNAVLQIKLSGNGWNIDTKNAFVRNNHIPAGEELTNNYIYAFDWFPYGAYAKFTVNSQCNSSGVNFIIQKGNFALDRKVYLYQCTANTNDCFARNVDIESITQETPADSGLIVNIKMKDCNK